MEARAAKLRLGMELCFGQEYILLKQVAVSDEQLLRVTEQAEVRIASGKSDHETIRDKDSGSGAIRWHRRNPYCYRVELNDEDHKYRRLMKLKTLEGIGESRFEWEPLVDSDDEEGQPSFILKSSSVIIAAGEVIGDALRPVLDRDKKGPGEGSSHHEVVEKC